MTVTVPRTTVTVPVSRTAVPAMATPMPTGTAVATVSAEALGRLGRHLTFGEAFRCRFALAFDGGFLNALDCFLGRIGSLVLDALQRAQNRLAHGVAFLMETR